MSDPFHLLRDTHGPLLSRRQAREAAQHAVNTTFPAQSSFHSETQGYRSRVHERKARAKALKALASAHFWNRDVRSTVLPAEKRVLRETWKAVSNLEEGQSIVLHASGEPGHPLSEQGYGEPMKDVAGAVDVALPLLVEQHYLLFTPDAQAASRMAVAYDGRRAIIKREVNKAVESFYTTPGRLDAKGLRMGTAWRRELVERQWERTHHDAFRTLQAAAQEEVRAVSERAARTLRLPAPIQRVLHRLDALRTQHIVTQMHNEQLAKKPERELKETLAPQYQRARQRWLALLMPYLDSYADLRALDKAHEGAINRVFGQTIKTGNLRTRNVERDDDEETGA